MIKAYIISEKELAHILLRHITTTIAPELDNKLIDSKITFKEDGTGAVVEIKSIKPLPTKKKK